MNQPSHRSNLLGIRNRILIFGLIVTLAPSLGLGWFFYSNTEKLLQTNLEEELGSEIDQVQREIELWLKQSIFDIRVFSNSFVVTENLEQALELKNTQDGLQEPQQLATPVEVILEYLQLLMSQYDEISRFSVLGKDGSVIAQYPADSAGFEFPQEWAGSSDRSEEFLFKVAGGGSVAGSSLTLAVPVFSNKQAPIGFFAADFSTRGIQAGLAELSLPADTNISIIRSDGTLVVSSDPASQQGQPSAGRQSRLKELFDSPLQTSNYQSSVGSSVIGVLARLPHAPWGVVIEKSRDQAFAEIVELRNKVLISIAVLLILIGVAAYLVSQSIVPPLRRLISGATQVAAGDMNVELAVGKRDELGVAITVFNDMVARLRKNHEELQRISTLDSLTGLFNRNHLMKMFSLYVDRFHRSGTPFAILMADIDHFKKINDNHGHLVGDAVIGDISNIFATILRSVDTVGRYGGEEFLIILDDTQEEGARQVAERIRKTVENHDIAAGGKRLNVTISIGLATVCESAQTENDLINRADQALYKAKHGGRNRVESYSAEVLPLNTAKE